MPLLFNSSLKTFFNKCSNSLYLYSKIEFMLRIPYDKSDYIYQDRTSYIETLENWDTTYLFDPKLISKKSYFNQN